MKEKIIDHREVEMTQEEFMTLLQLEGEFLYVKEDYHTDKIIVSYRKVSPE